MIRSSKMREMKRRMQILYSRFFISFKPPFFYRLEVDTTTFFIKISPIFLRFKTYKKDMSIILRHIFLLHLE